MEFKPNIQLFANQITPDVVNGLDGSRSIDKLWQQLLVLSRVINSTLDTTNESIVYIQEPGEKKKGHLYMDKISNTMYKCIANTSSQSNVYDNFRPINLSKLISDYDEYIRYHTLGGYSFKGLVWGTGSPDAKNCIVITIHNRYGGSRLTMLGFEIRLKCFYNTEYTDGMICIVGSIDSHAPSRVGDERYTDVTKSAVNVSFKMLYNLTRNQKRVAVRLIYDHVESCHKILLISGDGGYSLTTMTIIDDDDRFQHMVTAVHSATDVEMVDYPNFSSLQSGDYLTPIGDNNTRSRGDDI